MVIRVGQAARFLLAALSWLGVWWVIAANGAETRDIAGFRSTTEPATVMYDAPSNKSKPLFVVGPGYPVEVMATLQGFTKVRDAGGTIAWIESRQLSPKRMVVVRSKVAFARAAPDEPSQVSYKLAQGVLLEWLETLPSGWIRVRHNDAGVGFVRAADLWGV
jgi:SH3-like domain-containing protein